MCNFNSSLTRRSTPINDASVVWSSDFLTAAKLTISKDAIKTANDSAFVEAAEKEGFGPWKALAEHRPLGAVMRARKGAYVVASAKNR